MSKSKNTTSKKVYHDPYKKTPTFEYAGFIKRFCGYLIDFYIGMLLCSLPIVLGNGIINQSEKMQMNLFFFEGTTFYIIAALSLLIGFWYYVYIPLKVWKGQTLAKRMLHLKIVKVDGENVDMKALFLRQVVGMFLVEGAVIACSSLLRQMLTYITAINFVDSFIYIGFGISIVSILLMVFSRKRRMIHDFIGTTMVIQNS